MRTLHDAGRNEDAGGKPRLRPAIPAAVGRDDRGRRRARETRQVVLGFRLLPPHQQLLKPWTK
jgi:hypothetical protein